MTKPGEKAGLRIAANSTLIGETEKFWYCVIQEGLYVDGKVKLSDRLFRFSQRSLFHVFN